MRYGMPALKTAVVGGQYEYAKGLFFGGKRLQEGIEKYQAFLAKRLASVERLPGRHRRTHLSMLHLELTCGPSASIVAAILSFLKREDTNNYGRL